MKRETRRCIFDLAVWIAGAFFLAALAIDAAAGERSVFAASDAVWSSERGGCHLAYPPQLLGASSWRAIMQVSTATSAPARASTARPRSRSSPSSKPMRAPTKASAAAWA